MRVLLHSVRPALQQTCQESVSSVLYKCWKLYGGVNNDLLQEDLRHTRTQSPCSAALLPQETLKHSSGCLCGVPGSWCAQGLFEPSEHLCREWGLILNANSSLLPSLWDFSFALGQGVSPHSCSRAYRLTGVSLTLDVGYLLMAGPVKHSCSS